MKTLLSIITIVLTLFSAHAQPQKGTLIDIKVYPVAGQYDVSTGDPIDFEVIVYQYGKPVQSGVIEYIIGPEKFESGRMQAKIKNGKAHINGSSMTQPGFYRCYAYYTYEGKEYRNSSTVGVDKNEIEPTQTLPEDFQTFWADALAEARKTPLEPTMELMPDRGTPTVDFYHVSFKVYGKKRFYGVLSMPKKEGKYPAKLTVPGAGVRAYKGTNFELDRVINLQVGIHGIPVNLYNSSIYEDLRTGALNGYAAFNMDDRDRYYYNRVYLGCVRAVDFIHTLPQFDGETVAISGGSQGGALAIITASLDPRIDYLTSYFPALSDMSGFLHGRAGGWPHFFRGGQAEESKVETVSYYDVVNFAKNLKIPGFYSYGYNDNVCPPTSVCAVLNSISADKTVEIAYDVGHFNYPEVWKKNDAWLIEKLIHP